MKIVFALPILITILITLLLNIPSLANEKIGYEWTVNMEEDPLTDEVNIIMMGIDVSYFEGSSSWDSDIIGLRLSNNKISLIVIPNDYIGRDNNDVKYRFDDGEVVDSIWSLSVDNSGFFHPDHSFYPLKNFVKKMIVHDRLVFNYQPYNKNRRNIIFCTINFGPELKPYLEYFGWDDLADLIQ